MKSLLTTFTALLLLVSNSARADWTGPQVIQGVYPQANADQVIIQLPNYNPAQGCSHINGKYLMLTNHPNSNAILALLLTAHAAGTPVNIHLATGACVVNNFSQITMVISGTIN
jgi:hypothetical protein